MAFALVARGVSKVDAHARADTMMERLGLPAERYARRRPVTLSVGEARRVALAGVLVAEPDVSGA